MEIIRNKKKPRGITGVIAAVEGYGKTTTVAGLPGIYMLDVDDGSYGLDCPIIRFNGTVAGMLGLIAELKSDKCPSDMQTLGIDTADMLVQMLTRDLCKRKHWSSMEEKDYGKCWGEFKPEWCSILNGLKNVARTKGINVIYTLHISGDKTFTEKTTGKQWNRWMARMTPKCSEELYSSTDFYFSGLYDVQTMEAKAGRTKMDLAVSEERIVYTDHSSDHDGKCRLFVVMPDGSKMPRQMTLDDFQKKLPGILAASTDKTANPDEFVEPKNEQKPEPGEVRDERAGAAAEPAQEKVAEQPEKPAQKAGVPPYVSELNKLLDQYGIGIEKIRERYATKMTERYGMSITEPVESWPEDFVRWLCDGMEKISQKLK